MRVTCRVCVQNVQKVPGVIALASELKQMSGVAADVGAPNAALAAALKSSLPATLSSSIAPVLSAKSKKKKKKAKAQADKGQDSDSDQSAAEDEGQPRTSTAQRRAELAAATAAAEASAREAEQLRAETLAAYKQSKRDARTAALRSVGVQSGVTAAEREAEADAQRKQRMRNSTNRHDPDLVDDEEREALAAKNKSKRSVAGALASAIKKKALKTDGSALLSNL